MTLAKTQAKLMHYLATSDTFGLENVREAFPNEMEGKCDLRVVRLALAKLVEIGVLEKLDTGEYWVLTKPLTSYSQTLKLTGETAAAVARLVNLANQKLKNAEETPNLLRISEKDIQTLCFVSAAVLESNEIEDKNEQPKAIGFGD